MFGPLRGQARSHRFYGVRKFCARHGHCGSGLAREEARKNNKSTTDIFLTKNETGFRGDNNE